MCVSSLPGVQQLAGFQSVPAQPQLRPKARIRTVFTDRQTTQLEALFELNDYPSVEERDEVASSAGLTEEIVRVSVHGAA